MHFNNVGKSYWNKYILGIIQCYARTGETYGNNKPSDSDYNGHIGVGETWGFAMGYYMANKKLGVEYRTPSSEYYWFYPERTYALLTEQKINPINFLNCMNSMTNDLDKLTNQLISKNINISRTFYN